MRSITGANSAFWLRLQSDEVNVAELITLTYNGGTLRFCASDKPIVSSGYIFDPFPGRSLKGTEESTDLAVGNASFIMANTGSIIGKLMQAYQLDMATVVVERVFQSTPDLGRLEVFRGSISDYSFDRNTVTGNLRNIFGGRNQQWPEYTYKDSCSWRFGSAGCGFNTASITISTSIQVSSSDRNTLFATSGFISSSYGVDVFTFGKVTITSGVNSGQVRSVFSNTGDIIKLSHTLPYSHDVSGVTFSLYRGCKKNLVPDCRSIYNNTSAYLGFEWIPKLGEIL